jgi:hypothetical protein
MARPRQDGLPPKVVDQFVIDCDVVVLMAMLRPATTARSASISCSIWTERFSNAGPERTRMARDNHQQSPVGIEIANMGAYRSDESNALRE